MLMPSIRSAERICPWSTPSSSIRSFGGSLDKDHAIAVFNAHNEEVRRTVPPERLLVYESGEGWEPLCAFLAFPCRKTPYPKVNTHG